MPLYSVTPSDEAKSCKARGSHLRVHFKNTREAAAAISGMTLKRAKTYLNDVLAHKDIIPYRRYNSVARHAQAHKFGVTLGAWPEKSVKYLLDLLSNAESNAELKGLDVDQLYVSHVQVNHAPKMRRRTYRAHGRINPFMSNPCHIELMLSQQAAHVKKGDESGAAKTNRTKRIKQGASVAVK